MVISNRFIRNTVKHVIALIFYETGIFFLARLVNNFRKKRITILTYHRVSDRPINAIKESLPYLFVSENTFARQCEFLKKYYHIINFKDLVKYTKQDTIPKNTLIITFDDGYEDFYTNAYPILTKNKLKCTLFLTTDFIDENRVPWWDEIFFLLKKIHQTGWRKEKIVAGSDLSWIADNLGPDFAALFSELNAWDGPRIDKLQEDLKRYAGASGNIYQSANRFLNWKQITGMQKRVEFGSHTCTHASLNNLSDDEVRYEVIQSMNLLENRLGEKITVFSYPAGHFTEEIKRIVSGSGYIFAVTQKKGINNLEDKYALKRINVWEGTANATRGKFSKALFALRLSAL